MQILKYLFLIIFILLLFFLEISGLFSPKIDLVFIFLILVLMKESQRKSSYGEKILNSGHITAILNGFLLDLYSVFPPGTFILIFLVIVFLNKKFLLPKFDLDKTLSLFFFVFLVVFFYQILILIGGYLSYFLGVSSLRIVLNKFYYFDFIQSLFLNSVLIIFFFKANKLIKDSKQSY